MVQMDFSAAGHLLLRVSVLKTNTAILILNVAHNSVQSEQHFTADEHFYSLLSTLTLIPAFQLQYQPCAVFSIYSSSVKRDHVGVGEVHNGVFILSTMHDGTRALHDSSMPEVGLLCLLCFHTTLNILSGSAFNWNFIKWF